jgi:hypothetical protein
MAIYANPRGYDNFALVRFSQAPLKNRHQLIWTPHFGCWCGMKSHRESFGLVAFSFCSTSYTSVVFSIPITEGNFVVRIGNFATSFSCKLSYKGTEHDPAFTCDIRCCRHRLCSVIHKQNSLSTSPNHDAFFPLLAVIQECLISPD